MRNIICASALLISVAVPVSTDAADTSLAAARDLYVSASYDDALAMLAAVFVCLCLCRGFARALCLCLFTACSGLFCIRPRFCRLYWRCRSLCLGIVSLSTHLCRLFLHGTGTSNVFGPRFFLCHRDCCEQQHDHQGSAHGFSFRLSRLRRSAIHLATSVSFGTSRLYAS